MQSFTDAPLGVLNDWSWASLKWIFFDPSGSFDHCLLSIFKGTNFLCLREDI